MKQKTIKTTKATLLVVELPEGARDIVVTTFNRIGFYSPNGISSYKMLPEGNWQLLGRLPDITETQLMLILPIHRQSIIGDVYKDFITGKYDAFDLYESLYSLLQANEVYFDNPIPPFKERFEDWQEVQSKVWDKERTYLFIKVD